MFRNILTKTGLNYINVLVITVVKWNAIKHVKLTKVFI
jgi:hypothetical protein